MRTRSSIVSALFLLLAEASAVIAAVGSSTLLEEEKEKDGSSFQKQQQQQPQLRHHGQHRDNNVDERYLMISSEEEDFDIDDFGFQHKPHNNNIQTRIVGGEIADASDYPYNVNLFGCGGALVAPDIIMTAAHCQYLNSWSVLIGGSTALTGELRYIEWGSASIHPLYESNDQNFDIMLYKLSRASRKTPVTLNSMDNNPSGTQQLKVLGFGSTQENGSGSLWLREVSVNHVDHKTCKDAYKGFAGTVDADTMVCAGVDGGGKDSCQGDSGGPLIDPVTGVIVGITSWGNGCGKDGFPGVYARVSDFIPWLEEEICRLSDDPPNSMSCPGATPDNNDSDDSGSSSSSGNGFWDWFTNLFQF